VNNEVSSESMAAQEYQGPDKLRRLETLLKKQNKDTLEIEEFSRKLLLLFPRRPSLMQLTTAEAPLANVDMSDMESLFKACVERLVHCKLLPGNCCPSAPDSTFSSLRSTFIENCYLSITSFLKFVCWMISCVWEFDSADKNRMAYLSEDLKIANQTLCGILGLPSNLEMFTDIALEKAFSTKCMFSDIVKFMWGDEIKNFTYGTLPPCTDNIKPVHMAMLPEKYLEVVRLSVKRKCHQCGNRPREPAICVICGGLVCINACCRNTGTSGECTRHALSCGGGQGLFICVHIGVLLAIDAPRCCFIDSPYVDRYGEPDPKFKRGVVLSLNKRIAEEVQMLYTLGELGSHIVRTNERKGRYIPDPL